MIVAVVVTHSAGAVLLGRCLRALEVAGGFDHLVVVDNGDQDLASVTSSAEIVRVPNEGYGAAANRGFDRARELGADTIALLNDDVIVRAGWLAPLVERLGDDIGAVQPKLLYTDRPSTTINSLGVAIGPDGAGVDIGVGEPDRDVPAGEIEAFTGGAVVMSRAFVDDTGGFDDRFFLYYEDVDLAERGRDRGWRYWCEPGAVVDHVGSATTGSDPEQARFLQERNRLWCAFRNADAATIGRALWLSIRRLRHAPRAVHARALAAGLAGAPQRLLERRRVTGGVRHLR